MAEDPLTVGPSVVVLGVKGEGSAGETEFAGGGLEGGDDGATVLPDVLRGWGWISRGRKEE